MRDYRQPGGYTIIEIMIFLAVSGFMFLIAAYFIQGKQSQTQFTQSMQDINTQVQQVINDVSDNNYPPTGLSCTIEGSSMSISASATDNQGTNVGCNFLGEVIQFGVAGNSQMYNVYTVASCQFYPCGASSDPTTATPPSDFYEATPTVVDNSNSAYSNVTTNMTDKHQLEWGMEATGMYYENISGNIYPTNSIGFFNSFAQQQGSGEGLVSGSQEVNVLNTGYTPGLSSISIAPGSSNNVDESGMVGDLNTYLQNSSSPTPITNPYFVVCFKDGHGHAGDLVVGGANSLSGGSGPTSVSGQKLSTAIHISDSSISPFGTTGSGASDVCNI